MLLVGPFYCHLKILMFSRRKTFVKSYKKKFLILFSKYFKNNHELRNINFDKSIRIFRSYTVVASTGRKSSSDSHRCRSCSYTCDNHHLRGDLHRLPTQTKSDEM